MYFLEAIEPILSTTRHSSTVRQIVKPLLHPPRRSKPCKHPCDTILWPSARLLFVRKEAVHRLYFPPQWVASCTPDASVTPLAWCKSKRRMQRDTAERGPLQSTNVASRMHDDDAFISMRTAPQRDMERERDADVTRNNSVLSYCIVHASPEPARYAFPREKGRRCWFAHLQPLPSCQVCPAAIWYQSNAVVLGSKEAAATANIDGKPQPRFALVGACIKQGRAWRTWKLMRGEAYARVYVTSALVVME